MKKLFTTQLGIFSLVVIALFFLEQLLQRALNLNSYDNETFDLYIFLALAPLILNLPALFFGLIRFKPQTTLSKVGLVIGLVFSIYSFWPMTIGEFTDISAPSITEEAASELATEERQKIETWIQANNLNEFGDPNDRAYTGGTPLFDEKTGQRIDRYDYILSQHPDRPWNQ